MRVLGTSRSGTELGGEICGAALSAASAIEEALEEWSEKGQVAACYADAEFHVRPYASFNLSDCSENSLLRRRYWTLSEAYMLDLQC